MFGLPFLLAGVVLVLGALGVVPIHDEFSHPIAPLALAWISLVPLGFGGILVFGRRTVTMDVSLGSLTQCYSVIAPLRTRQRHLSEFNAIVIGFERGDSESVDKFPVQLRAVAGKTFTILSPVAFGESRKLAAFLARELRLPLADTTTEHEIVLAPEHAGEPLQERLRNAPAAMDRPAPPSSMRSAVNESAVETSIVIPIRPSPVSGTIAGLGAGVVLFVIAPMVWRIWSRADTSLPVRLFFLAFLVILFGITPLAWAGTALGLIRNRVVVRGSPSGLTIQRQGTLYSKSQTIPAADILDIDYSTFQGILKPPGDSSVSGRLAKFLLNPGVIVKARAGLVTFGEGLPPDELRFLVWVLKKSLAAPTR